MIVYGVHVTHPELFEDECLPTIAAHGGEDATLMTADEGGAAEAYNQILDAAQAREDVEAVVLLHERATITDERCADIVRETLADGIDVAGVMGASGGGGLDWWTWDRRHGLLTTDHGAIRHSTGTERVDVVDGVFTILSPRSIETLRYDARSFPGAYGFDIDLCFQAAEAGLTVAVVDLGIVRHGENPARGDEYEKAVKELKRKWPGRVARSVAERASATSITPPTPRASSEARASSDRAAGTKLAGEAPANYFEFERPELLALVPAGARRVLDVGCASGALGASLKRQRPECEVSGVEYVQSVVDQAATRLDHAVRADLNGPIDLPFEHSYFDAMIFGDVLEHLLDPHASLARLLPWLSSDGVIVASIPNVKHWSVMIPALAEDRWEYTDAGLLDRTHVHLFTLRESIKMLNEVGLGNILHLRANTIPPSTPGVLQPLVNAAAAYGANGEEAEQLLNAYQFLVVASRPD